MFYFQQYLLTEFKIFNLSVIYYHFCWPRYCGGHSRPFGPPGSWDAAEVRQRSVRRFRWGRQTLRNGFRWTVERHPWKIARPPSGNLLNEVHFLRDKWHSASPVMTLFEICTKITEPNFTSINYCNSKHSGHPSPSSDCAVFRYTSQAVGGVCFCRPERPDFGEAGRGRQNPRDSEDGVLSL